MIFNVIPFLVVRLALVAAGAAIGGMGRYLLTVLLPWRGGFPWATFTVNVLGSLVLGVTSGLLAKHCQANRELAESIRCFAVVGVCGGFTTFSTFSNEAFRLLENAQWVLAALYLGASIAAGVAAVCLGYALAR